MASVLVLSGGTSSERAVSLRSGAAVADALRQVGHEVIIADPAEALEKPSVEVVFPVLHGKGGEDGQLQQLIESWQLPYVGSAAAASALCFDKARFKAAFTAHGVRMAGGEIVDAMRFPLSPFSKAPFVLKPIDGGSSVDTFIVRDPAHFDTSVLEAAFARHPHMLLEALIEGREVTVGVLGGEPLPVVEIIPPENGEFDYENKYNGATQELCPPRNIDAATQRELQKLALKVHVLSGCRDLSRTDFIVTKTNEPYLLETNTMPGMTAQSLYPKAAAAAGYSMTQLCDKLVQSALARH